MIKIAIILSKTLRCYSKLNFRDSRTVQSQAMMKMMMKREENNEIQHTTLFSLSSISPSGRFFVLFLRRESQYFAS